jgi:cyclohexyl-isocyanide hydratase
MNKYKIVMILFPDLTLLDFVGPYDAFVRAPCFEVITVSEQAGVFVAEGGLELSASCTFDDCPAADILFVPGGRGITPLLTNKKFHSFLLKQAEHAKYITSVCTGSLLLGACGLLKGFAATTHWRSYDLLQMFGADVRKSRVVVDRNRITGGGITAGIDFGLTLTALLGGEEMAKTIQLMLEYDPQPPFNSGSPDTAPPAILAQARKLTQPLFEQRLSIIRELTSAQ